MIIVAIGANLPAAGYETPLSTCEAAVVRLAEDADIQVTGRSRWYESEPVPKSDQPWFVNGAVSVETDLLPEVLLARLHVIEESFGRVRRVRGAERREHRAERLRGVPQPRASRHGRLALGSRRPCML